MAEGCACGADDGAKDATPPYDRDRLVELFGNHPKTLAEVEREFVETAREAEREIGDADDLGTIARARAPRERRLGHDRRVGAVAEAPERAAKAGDLPGVRRMQIFSQEVKRAAEQAGLTVAAR